LLADAPGVAEGGFMVHAARAGHRTARTGRTWGFAALLAVAATGSLTACGGGLKQTAATSSDVIKIGYIAPRTGVYAGFSDGDAYMLRTMRETFAKGLTIGGKKYGVQILDRDTGSDPQKAGQLADELINSDHVDVLLATSTPETVNPVSAKCEAEGVPCITTIAPWQAVYFGQGATPDKPLKWTYHFFFGLEGFADVDPTAWDQIPTNHKVGVLWPNDADGGAFRDPVKGYAPIAKKHGYTVVDPGKYEDGTKDFSAIIARFKAEHVDIVAGVPTPPDFVTFWTQAAQQGFRPKAVTVGKALFFPATVPSIPNNLGDGLSFAAWWGPTFPYTSSLTGKTPQSWISDFQSSPEGKGKDWNEATPLNESLFEVASRALRMSGDPRNHQAVVDSLPKTKMQTLAGLLDWTGGPTNPVKNVATIPTVIGQWEHTGGTWKWVVVADQSFPQVPAERRLKALS